jgi:TolB protein
MKSPAFCLLFLFVAALLTTAPAPAAPYETEIVRTQNFDGAAKPIPLSLSGFSGEVEAVLQFDLTVQGFSFVAPEKADYLVKGSNGARVEGQLFDAVGKQVLFGKAYAGGSLRAQAHALADDIVAALRRLPPIGRTKVAFKNDTGRTSEIFVSDLDGHGASAATADGQIVAAPTWSPGSRLLFYTSYKMGNPDIFSHDLDSGTRRVVARYSGLNTSAAISPDGRRVAMILSKSGAPNVWVADADGSNLMQLTKTVEGDSSPCWSPDGKTICFSSRASGRSALYTVPAAGGAMQRLSTPGALNATEPDWSPDGTSIVFTRQQGDFEVCVVPAPGFTPPNGSREARVLRSGEDPSWAPNSRTVIYARRVGGKRVLSMLDVPTKQTKDLRTISGSCSQPSWSK